LARAVLRHFIDRSGTKILARIAVLLDALRRTHIQVRDVQVAWLIFFVTRSGVIDVGETVERSFPSPAKRGVAGWPSIFL